MKKVITEKIKTEWNVDFIDFQVPSNMYFSFGAIFCSEMEALYMPSGRERCVVFKVNSTYFVTKQTLIENNIWCEDWTKQMNSSLLEAKGYAQIHLDKI